MLTASACVPVNEAINSRDLECREASDDVCTRLADDIVGLWDPADAAREGPIVWVVVQPVACDGLDRPSIARCWGVDASTASGVGLGGAYVQFKDGSLYDQNGAVVGD